MKRTVGVWMVLAALGGCMSAERVPTLGCGGGHGGSPLAVPGMQGPWGRPVAMAGPYNADPPGAVAARAMMAQSVPLDIVQTNGSGPGGMPSGIIQANASAIRGWPSSIKQAGGSGGLEGCPPGGGVISPPGLPPMPANPGMMPPPGAVAAAGALTGSSPTQFATQRTSVRFLNPAGMKVSWYTPAPDGRPGFATSQLETPGRYNFVQAAIYRLKLSNIPGRPGLELYPTLEVVPSNHQTETFLAHSAVPVSFTDEDFEQIASGNFLVKVIYLPAPQFQDLAATGPDEVVSSRLEPGADPIAEARRRGNILLVVRLGNIDLEAPNTPPMDAPNPYNRKNPTQQGMPGGVGPGRPAPGPMMPNVPMAHGNPSNIGPSGSMPMVPQGFPAGTPLMPLDGSFPSGRTGQPFVPSGPALRPANSGIPVTRLPDPYEANPVPSAVPPRAAPTLVQLANQESVVPPATTKPPLERGTLWMDAKTENKNP